MEEMEIFRRLVTVGFARRTSLSERALGDPGGPAQEVRVRYLAVEPPTMECAPPNAAHGICQEGLPAKRQYSPHQGLPSPATQSQTTISTVPIAERC
jgi:hypothetical protein